MLYVIPAADVVSSVTAPENSLPAMFDPVKVIVFEVAARKVAAAANDHEADVVRFVHAPETVHEPPVFVTYALVAPMLASPLIVIVEVRVLNTPSVDCASPVAVTARLPAEVSSVTAPVAPAALF